MAESDRGMPGGGGYDPWPGERRRFGTVELLALALSVVWLLLTAAMFLGGGPQEPGDPDPLRYVLTLVAVFLPLAMIWTAAIAARAVLALRDESRQVRLALDDLSDEIAASRPPVSSPELERQLREIASAAKKTETALATFTSIRTPPPPPKPSRSAPPPRRGSGEEQPSLGLVPPPGSTGTPLSTEDFIAALHFPETAEDKEGFRALRRALQDRPAAQLIQAAQDVLTLLSEDGIYMDDLSPDRARPELWRRFAQGERGRTVAALGGVRDREALAAATARMRADAIFRDAAHHFLRRFDQSFAAFEKTASDAEIAALTETRTARAFMLLGRVTGTFD